MPSSDQQHQILTLHNRMLMSPEEFSYKWNVSLETADTEHHSSNGFVVSISSTSEEVLRRRAAKPFALSTF